MNSSWRNHCCTSNTKTHEKSFPSKKNPKLYKTISNWRYILLPWKKKKLHRYVSCPCWLLWILPLQLELAPPSADATVFFPRFGENPSPCPWSFTVSLQITVSLCLKRIWVCIGQPRDIPVNSFVVMNGSHGRPRRKTEIWKNTHKES